MNNHSNKNEEEIVFEDDLESTSVNVDKKVKKIKEELKKCQEEKSQYLDGWQRAKADFINYRKRADEDLIIYRKYANEDLVLSILPTLDTFEMSLKDHGEGEEIKKWKIGFEHVYNQLKKTLESVGVIQLNPINESFDAKEHESLEMVDTDDKSKDHKISEVVMKGYKMGDKIIRHPQVKVWIHK